MNRRVFGKARSSLYEALSGPPNWGKILKNFPGGENQEILKKGVRLMWKSFLTCADPGLFFHDCVDCSQWDICNFQFKKEVKLKKKEKGSDSRNHHDPKRLTEAKRLLDSKRSQLESQESQMLMRFLAENPQIDVTLQIAETLWTFIRFLKKRGHHIVHEEEVFCVPFSHLVKKADLK